MPDKGHSWKSLMIQGAQTNQIKQMLNPGNSIHCSCSRYLFPAVPAEEEVPNTMDSLFEKQQLRENDGLLFPKIHMRRCRDGHPHISY